MIPALTVEGETLLDDDDNSSIGKPEEKIGGGVRKSSLAVVLPKLVEHHSSLESLSFSPQSSPGCDGESSAVKLSEVVLQAGGPTNLSRKESYKNQRQKYQNEKKRVARELLCTLKDPAVIVMADWLKVRGTLKGWTKLWCVLKPAMLLLYKSSKAKPNHWVGTILLSTCELIERPSKKDGFCFKLFHPLEQSIWATKGPEGEAIGAVVQPLPSSYLIFRTFSQEVGKCWMDALELAMRCSSILMRSMTSSKTEGSYLTQSSDPAYKWNEAEIENQFREELDDGSQTEDEQRRGSGNFSSAEMNTGSESDSEEGSLREEQIENVKEEPIQEALYIENTEEEIGETGQQTEVLADENKSLIWFLLKQIRPGMDLSRVVLPTFILEPRSFLDKLSDYYYHIDLLSKAVMEDDPYLRMKEVVRWYLSGFYKKPKGLKKPYNPILGEKFRCYWMHPTGSRTFYVAEQVSHHPPVSALYVTNRQEGFSVAAAVLARSRFYGNSISAILDGNVRLTLLPRGEDYVMNMPYAHCKGILMGTLTVELGGKVTVECEKTGYRAELEFKLKPFLSGIEASNIVAGKVKLGNEVLATIDGRWDQEISFIDRRTGEEENFWNVATMKENRLRRYTIPLDHQFETESERLWKFVSCAIKKDDQVAATEEKTILEEAQRTSTRERKAVCAEWHPQYFEEETVHGVYLYKYSDLRPWDPRTDLFQYEFDYKISTKTRHTAPMVRTSSIISVEPTPECLKSTETIPRILSALENRADTIDEVDNLEGESDVFMHNQSDLQIIEIMRRLLTGHEELMSEVKALKNQLEGLHKTLSVFSISRMQPNASLDLSGLNLTRFLSSCLAALILYLFFQWILKLLKF